MTPSKKQPASSTLSSFTKKKKFPIVGIGASAGGLEAVESFLVAMPADSGMAFVLVTHLAPNHTSLLPELLQKKTPMAVLQVTDNIKVEPNHVYIIPPNKDMSILNGSLQLMDLLQPRGLNLPIDNFFRSLAQDQQNHAICIVLSGTGTDGTLGLKAIKGEAGMAMVQDEKSSQYSGMPLNAIATGLADYVLPTDKMPEKLIQYTTSVMNTSAVTKLKNNSTLESALKKIFVLLRASTNHDFSLYKKNTLVRRIERRMHIHQIVDIAIYVQYLQESEKERLILFNELLIGVTSFFRDPIAFSFLKEKYLPALLEGKSENYQLRIWVPGCSSGEEVYTIAMIAQECMEAMGCHPGIQIFGTDIDEIAIHTARAGMYPDSIAANIDSDSLQQFFTKEENSYRVKKIIREMVIFAPQNIIKDPPFSQLDLISCRNLLIYFGSELQQRLFPIFHYSLKKNGILFLGSSETTSQQNDLFTCLNRKWKFFAPTSSALHTRQVPSFPLLTPFQNPMTPKETATPRAPDAFNMVKVLKSIIAQSTMPTCVVLDDQANIIFIHGRTGQFLEPAEGETSANIIDMAREGLKEGLKNAIHKASVNRQETIITQLDVKNNGGSLDIRLVVRPLPDFQTGGRGMMMVIFEPVATDGKEKSKQTAKHPHTSNEYNKLEEELRYTKENLQMTIEEVETSNEELKSTNEELQSTNEELQSTNEELETSKEELQSLNEESSTVNAELQTRIDQQIQANDDIKNLLDATKIATIFLNNELEVRRFTSNATAIFPLKSTDTGRPIQHFSSSLIDVDLQSLAKQVLNDLNMVEVEVNDTDKKYYRMRIRPYRTVKNVIDGVVVTFEDITKIKEIESQLELTSSSFEEKMTMMSKVFMDSADPIIIEDLDGIIIDANDEAITSYGWSRKELLGKHAADLSPKEKSTQIKKALDQCLAGTAVRNLASSCLHKSGQIIPVLLTFSCLTDKDGEPHAVAIIMKNYPAL